MSEKQNSLTYLNCSNFVKFKFDKMISHHDQVKHLSSRFIEKFLYPASKNEKDKIALNISDVFDSNNNAGFNLTNFKVKYINQFFQDVILDYEQSIIGTFTKNLIETINKDQRLKDSTEIYFTITKFESDYGYSLVHQEADNLVNPDGQLAGDLENQDIVSNHIEDAINMVQNNDDNINVNLKSGPDI